MPKNVDSCKKNADISKIKRALELKLNTRVYLRTKFQIFSITLMSFRQRRGGGILPFYPLPLTSKRTPKNPTQIWVKMLPPEQVSEFRRLADWCIKILSCITAVFKIRIQNLVF